MLISYAGCACMCGILGKPETNSFWIQTHGVPPVPFRFQVPEANGLVFACETGGQDKHVIRSLLWSAKSRALHAHSWAL